MLRCACCGVLAPNSAASSLPQATYFNRRGIQQQMPVCDLDSCARCSRSSPGMEEPGLRKSSPSDVCGDSCMQRTGYAENCHHLLGQGFAFKMCNNFSAFGAISLLGGIAWASALLRITALWKALRKPGSRQAFS